MREGSAGCGAGAARRMEALHHPLQHFLEPVYPHPATFPHALCFQCVRVCVCERDSLAMLMPFSALLGLYSANLPHSTNHRPGAPPTPANNVS